MTRLWVSSNVSSQPTLWNKKAGLGGRSGKGFKQEPSGAWTLEWPSNRLGYVEADGYFAKRVLIGVQFSQHVPLVKKSYAIAGAAAVVSALAGGAYLVMR
jgi:hypothetical protein